MKSFLYLFITLSVLAAPLCAQDIESKLSGNTSASGFTVKSNAGTGLFTIRGDGHVGIGTSATSQGRLVIDNTTTLNNALRITTNSMVGWSGVYLVQSGAGNAARFIIDNATSPNNCLEASTDGTGAALSASSTNATGRIAEFKQGASDRFFVKTDGNVGMSGNLGIGTGTATPGGRLEIAGGSAGVTNAIRIYNWSSSGSGIFLTQIGGGNAARFDISNATSANNCLEATTNAPAPAIFANSTNAAGKIIECTNGSTSRFSVASNGVVLIPERLGIGTTTPSFPLHIVNTTSTNSIRVQATSASSGVWGTQTGAGNVARFDITNATSLSNCLEVNSNAPAPAIYANSTNASGRIIQANNGTSTRFFVETTGNVGIGVDDATQDLDVLNNARFRGIVSSGYSAPLNITSLGILTTATSDRRLKTNIRPLGSTLDNVLQLRGVRYNWKSDSDGAERIGFIAQEVEELIPEVVYTNPVDGYKGLNYAELTAVLTEAVKEQQTLIVALKQKIDEVAALQQRVNVLETQSSRIRELEADLVSLKALLHENGTLGDRAHASLQSAK